MNLDEYFNEVQEYVKQNIEMSAENDAIIKSLEKDNIQAVINQDFNNNISIEECGEKVLTQLDSQDSQVDQLDPNPISGERGINTMENKNVVGYTDFLIKESKKQGKIIFEMTGSPRMDLQFFPAKERTKSKFALALSEHGYVQGRLNRDCDILITNEPNSNTNKMKKAFDYEIEIVTYADLIKKLNLFPKEKKNNI